MGLPKFFVAPGSVRGSFLTLEGENAAHARVLRLRQGDRVLVCDGCGTDYSCTISDISPQQDCLVVDSASASASEPRVQCSVYMAYAKADKLEHVIQKATELGAYEIAAFPSSRCVMRLDAAGAQKKLDRWQKIAASAAAQSGRGRIPQVLALLEKLREESLRALREITSFGRYPDLSACAHLREKLEFELDQMRQQAALLKTRRSRRSLAWQTGCAQLAGRMVQEVMALGMMDSFGRVSEENKKRLDTLASRSLWSLPRLR